MLIEETKYFLLTYSMKHRSSCRTIEQARFVILDRPQGF